MIVLDTHVWVWSIGGPGCPRLSAVVRRRMDEAETLGVSAVSCLEVAWLVARGRLVLDRDPLTWLRQALARPRTALLEIGPEVAVRAANLEWTHKDPADRIIVATALELRAPIASRDRLLRSYRRVQTVW
jgi:PIN domain nuclease of toxin-antitoxin system